MTDHLPDPAHSNIETLTSATGLATATAAHGDNPSLETPFEHIALAFSGGGFRAAAFSLGVLSYLNDVEFGDSNGQSSLLRKVRYISSASGGSFTSASLALARAEGKSFQEFFDSLYGNLEGQKVLTLALTHLNQKAPWRERPDKRRNIINAFALSYDQLLFNGKKIGDLRTVRAGGMDIPLEEVCFNATEFFRGQPFRQNVKIKADTKPDTFFYYGNFIYHLDPAIAADIRISDALAASSCFPVGFEPLKFPEDFTYDGLTKEALTTALQCNADQLDDNDCKSLKAKGFGLMDGGISDNQGLESLMLADLRRRKGETSFQRFDLALVNDVGSQYMKPYEVPPADNKSLLGKLSFVGFQRIFYGFLPLLILALVYLSYHSGTLLWKAICFGGAVLLTALVAVFAAINLHIPGKNSSMKPLDNFSPDVIALLLRFLGKTRLSIIYQMLAARASSTIILNVDVFLKRIRKLIFDSFFQAPSWKFRRKANHVYDLAPINDLNRKSHSTNQSPVLTKDIQLVAGYAFNVPTALWFGADKIPYLACLVACGQFNTCYNLQEYIGELKSNKPLFDGLSQAYKDRCDAIQKKLEADWAEFQKNPFVRYNHYHPEGKLIVGGGVIKSS